MVKVVDLSIGQVIFRLGFIGAFFLLCVFMFIDLVSMHSDSNRKNGVVGSFPMSILDRSHFTDDGLKHRKSFIRLWVLSIVLSLVAWFVF